MTELTCRCGAVHLEISGPPILSAECCCDSCRAAAERIGALDGAPDMLGPHGTTHFVLCRKDRVAVTQGKERLAEFRLTPKSHTRRIVATCCNTPIALDFSQGHWFSVYAALWPEGIRPQAEMRTMVSDLPPGTVLPDDIPNSRKQSPAFMWRLLKAWAAMRFRVPKLNIPAELRI